MPFTLTGMTFLLSLITEVTADAVGTMATLPALVILGLYLSTRTAVVSAPTVGTVTSQCGYVIGTAFALLGALYLSTVL